MTFSELDEPKKTDDEDDDDDDDEEEEEEEDDDDDYDEEEFVTCGVCESSLELSSYIQKYMNRGGMTESSFTCPACLAEQDKSRRERKAAKAKKGAA